MKEKLVKVKDKIVEFTKNTYSFLKKNPVATAALGFVLVSLVIILIATLALKEFVVSVCILIVLEAVMAALLHNAEIWKHGILVVAQVVAAVIFKGLPLIILCIIAYVAAIFALQYMAKSKKVVDGPKA